MRGYFGIGIYHGKTEVNLGTLMRSAYCFGANYIFTVGRRYKRQASDTVNAASKIPLYTYQNMDDLYEHLPASCRLIGVELDEGAREVGRFSHPEQAAYLLGAEDHGIPAKDLKRCHAVIQIPDTLQCLNVAVAGSIVLFDRANHFRNRFRKVA